MITYEITATVQPDLIEAYENYMIDRHIPHLMETGCFASATFSRNSGRYRIRYEAHDRDTLTRYLKDHATRLRDDFADHFPTGIELSRDTWDVVTAFFSE
jgi:predicted transcriptional regulator